MVLAHSITGSLFHSGSNSAKFDNGIELTGNLSSSGVLVAEEFLGMSADAIEIPLNVGKAINNDDGTTTFENWIINVGETAIITASGVFDTFCFVENQTLNDNNPSNSTWRTVSKGDGNGLVKSSSFTREYNQPGVYEYLIIANNNTTKKTIVKGTTVTVNTINLTNPLA